MGEQINKLTSTNDEEELLGACEEVQTFKLGDLGHVTSLEEGALAPECRGGGARCGGGGVPPLCRQHDAVYTILHYLTDIHFPSTKVATPLRHLRHYLNFNLYQKPFLSPI